jgi:hypothetical protein
VTTSIADENAGTFRSMIFIPEMTTTLQDMFLDDKGDAREVSARLFSQLWASGAAFHSSVGADTHVILGLHGEVFTAETFSVLHHLLRTDNEARMFAFKLIFDLAQHGGETVLCIDCLLSYILQ